ncbi:MULTISPECIES: hypothetical protein [Bacillus]|nr:MULTISPECIES: hypothetical protein [Bacillus]MBR0588514.1 hypothetical protein [Bacillus pumilus DW2J2]MBR0618446.1 hypothetical protein [Bacillus pumilus]MBR0624741.1 hypothetical protein [Bacillus pumilus]MCY7724100.1 hypothetical protein [Bacillus pumilus]MCY7747411.1 hypothetical protein [Bacillus pumilus]
MIELATKISVLLASWLAIIKTAMEITSLRKKAKKKRRSPSKKKRRK